MIARSNISKSITGALAIALLGFVGLLGWFFSARLPDGFDRQLTPSVEFRDRHGTPLRTILVDDHAHVRLVTPDRLPQNVVAATLAAEDRRFFSHCGVDIQASLRAIGQWIRSGRLHSGASTISQQLIKLTHPGERSLARKLHEIRLGIALERQWTKEEILAGYVNRLEYGDLQQGIESAAQYYFGKNAFALSIAESAFLAGLPNAPTALQPHQNFAGAKARQQYVLNRMLANGALTPEQHGLASEEQLILRPRGHNFRAPHFVQLMLTRPNLKPDESGIIDTTLDLELNDHATLLLGNQLATLRGNDVNSGAVVVIHNPTGEVLVMTAAGKSSDGTAQQVNCAWMPRSPGSAIKPFSYILAMEAGAFPGTVVPDVATSFATPTGVYRPNNYNHRFYGPVSLRDALGNSLNLAAIRTLKLGGGPENLHQLLRELDFTTLTHPADHYGLGLTLGNAETRLAELAAAYATIARLGIHRPMRLTRPNSHEHRLPDKRVFSAASAWLVADILADNSARAASFGLDSFLALPFPAGTKTGTSSNYRDNVAVGFTKEFTVAVWVGNADGSPMRKITGVTGAAPLMHEMLCHLDIQFGTSWLTRPSDIQSIRINPYTGKRVAEPSPHAVDELCSSPAPEFMTADDFDENGKLLLPTEYADWIASPHNTHGALFSSRRSAAESLVIRSPDSGTIYFLDPDLPSTRQRVRPVVQGEKTVQWHCESLTDAADGSGFELKPGKHYITAEDPATAQTASTWIEVREL
jgi:penicillin-binding protein 1C